MGEEEINGRDQLLAELTDLRREVRELREANIALNQRDHIARQSVMVSRTVLECCNGSVTLCSQDFRIEFADPEFQRRIGRDPVGESCYRVLHDRDAACPWCPFEPNTADRVPRAGRMKGPEAGRYAAVRVPLGPDQEVPAINVIHDTTDVTKTRDALYQSQVLLSNILSAAPMGIGCVENGRLKWANEAMLRMFGDDAAEDWLGRFPREVYADNEEYERVRDELRKGLEHGKTVGTEARFRRSDGSIFYGLIKVVAADPRRPRAGTITAITDVTARKLAEEALRESEEQYRKLYEQSRRGEQLYLSLLNASPDPIVVYDVDGAPIYLNPAFTRVFGWKLGELAGKPIDYVPSEDRQEARVMIEQVKRGGFLTGQETRRFTKDGRIVYVTISGAPFTDANGAVAGSVIHLRDVTERRQAQQTIKESEAMMRLVIESSPIGITIIQDERCLYVNPALVRMFDYDSASEIQGRPLEAIVAAEHQDLIKGQVTGHIAGEGPSLSYEIRGIKKSGHSFEISVWLTAILFKGAPALLAFLVDVSEEKALRTQLMQAQKMEALGTLAGGIAHDFNNILFVITGNAEMAQDETTEGTRLSSYVRSILEAAGRARDMVNQILTFSRQSETEKRPMLVAPLVKETLKFLRASIPSTIETHGEIAHESGMVLADPTQVHQVLMNLCTNAAHAMRKEGGSLTVGLRRVRLDADQAALISGLNPGSFLQLSVSDTGHGMTEEVVERIFDPYFSTKKPGEGTGLGLAVVHGIVRTLGGAITVHSRHGKGSTFDVYLPEIMDASGIVSRPAAYVPRGDGRVLLVDDDPAVLRTLSQVMQGLGYAVTTTEDSLRAAEIFRSRPEDFDLVITDMTMPHLTGVDLAREVRATRPGIPVILCTGFSELINEDQAEEMGISALLMKPILRSRLAATILDVLEKADARQEKG